MAFFNPQSGIALSLANKGELIAVRLGSGQMIKALAFNEINSPNVTIFKDNNRYYAFCESSPQQVRKTTVSLSKTRPSTNDIPERPGYAFLILRAFPNYSNQVEIRDPSPKVEGAQLGFWDVWLQRSEDKKPIFICKREDIFKNMPQWRSYYLYNTPNLFWPNLDVSGVRGKTNRTDSFFIPPALKVVRLISGEVNIYVQRYESSARLEISYRVEGEQKPNYKSYEELAFVDTEFYRILPDTNQIEKTIIKHLNNIPRKLVGANGDTNKYLIVNDVSDFPPIGTGKMRAIAAQLKLPERKETEDYLLEIGVFKSNVGGWPNVPESFLMRLIQSNEAIAMWREIFSKPEEYGDSSHFSRKTNSYEITVAQSFRLLFNSRFSAKISSVLFDSIAETTVNTYSNGEFIEYFTPNIIRDKYWIFPAFIPGFCKENYRNDIFTERFLRTQHGQDFSIIESNKKAYIHLGILNEKNAIDGLDADKIKFKLFDYLEIPQVVTALIPLPEEIIGIPQADSQFRGDRSIIHAIASFSLTYKDIDSQLNKYLSTPKKDYLSLLNSPENLNYEIGTDARNSYWNKLNSTEIQLRASGLVPLYIGL